MTIAVGDTVRLLDRSGDVRGTVESISTAPYRPKRPILVQLAKGHDEFWFGPEELEVLRRNPTRESAGS